ncbi:MAG TPA: hypothetical protein VEK11_26010 [Thermoanaerobaculia bacterium]|nr:hypothetical protein [Thermoanaerobaculia bacterium]
MRIAVALSLLLLAACASNPPAEPITAPQWDTVPPGVAEGLCRRLQSDALATGPVTIVKVTQPLITQEVVVALASSVIHRGRATQPVVVNRAIPISTTPASCAWIPIDVRDVDRNSDTMVVELSAPMLNPYRAGEAGAFARASLAGQHESWYWIPLVRRGDRWTAGVASVLFK